MNRLTRSWVILWLLSLAAYGASTVAPRQWPVYGGDLAGTKYSELSQINRSNVGQLQPAWVFHAPEIAGRLSTIECNPLVIRDVIYLTSPSLKVFALEAATGQKIWEFVAPTARAGVNRGFAYWEQGRERRLFFSAGPFLYALDPATGRPVPSFGKDGSIDMREGLDQDVSYLHFRSNTPGIVYRDLLIMGSEVGEGPSPAAPGHIRAFDVRTGARRWIFRTIPRPGEPGHETWPPDAWKTVGGANSWGGFSLDEKRGIVFCGTGSASYDHYGGNRIGKNLYANCILALDAATGKLKWHFQAVHHDLWDYDLPCPPVLVKIRPNNRPIDALVQTTKMGHLFVLERETGKPVFPIEERPVPQSTLPGEQTWPTQPYPVKPPPYAQQRLTAAEATDLDPESHAWALERLRGMRTGDMFLPPGLDPAVTLPQFNGGTDWGGGAFNPRTGVFYVNTSNEAEWISMVPSTSRRPLRLGDAGSLVFHANCSICHSTTERSTTGGGPQSLRNVSDRLTREQVTTLLQTGRGLMPSFPGLSGGERRALLAFLFRDGDEEMVDPHTLPSLESMPYVATGHNEFRDPKGFPANKRPWGTLSAIDLNKGAILWQVPLGTYPQLEAKGYPPTGTFNMGGPIVTAGGLVFIGGAMDERFRAFDSDTGQVLWQYQMNAGGYATPATFEVRGRQYVVIAAGGGGKPETKSGDAYYCFALPER
jgi:quinoprotein glucose dehydrogenase